MPAVLSDSNLCAGIVPGCWQGVLETLQAFLELEKSIRSRRPDAPSAQDLALLSELHDRLIATSAGLLEPLVLADLPEADSTRLVARALFLVTRINQCILGEDEVLDTAGCRTLPLYEADFYRSPENLDRLRVQIERRLGISGEELVRIERDVDRSLSDAHRKQAICRAIVHDFRLRADEPDLQQHVFELFRTLYPDAPLVRGEVELILTSTLIFFCIPFAGDGLTTPRFHLLDAAGQQQVREFLGTLQKFTQDRFANFPAFGSLDPDGVSPQLLKTLSQQTGLPPESVANELARMITVLPLAEIDQYVVHDVWGHGWQASMLGFEDMYLSMSQYADPLRLDETADSRLSERITFRSCFAIEQGQVTLDEPRLRRFIASELAERLGVAMTAVLAELIADVAEFKLLADVPDLLPSSSLFKLLPSKLDLTMQDVPFYFGQATKAFRLWANSTSRRSKTCQELVVAGASESSAQAAVAQAAITWEHLASTDYAPQLAWQPAGEELRVNVFTRLALNFLGIHRAVLEVYRHLATLSPGELPLKSFRDLLILGAGVFFEADRPRNLWRVDEFLTLRFLPLCRRLGLGT